VVTSKTMQLLQDHLKLTEGQVTVQADSIMWAILREQNALCLEGFEFFIKRIGYYHIDIVHEHSFQCVFHTW
jgi:hypothetical protein